jgi:hypothetical protein
LFRGFVIKEIVVVVIVIVITATKASLMAAAFTTEVAITGATVAVECYLVIDYLAAVAESLRVRDPQPFCSNYAFRSMS